MGSLSGVRFLHQLARLYGVQTVYYDVAHRRRQASAEALLVVLQSLGAPLATLKDVPRAWRERRQALWQRLLEPVVVTWDGGPSLIKIRLPAAAAGAALNCHLELETGEQQSWKLPEDDPPVAETAEIEGTRYVVRQLLLPERLPRGYHRLTVEVSGRSQETLIISAPLKAYVPQTGRESRSWGIFVPLYALHSEKSWGAGNFSDLEALTAWVAQMGGGVVATLPLLTTCTDRVADPSPYLPVSRRLWNEFYVDINKVPERQKCPSAQALIESSSFQKEVEALRRSSLVDYRRQMALKRGVLKELCRCLLAEPSRRLSDLQQFTGMNPVVEDYARFMAAGEKQGTSWRAWPEPLREGVLGEADYSEEDRRYHLYVPWLAEQQVQSIAQKAADKGLQLYLDLPLGVHPDGYDVWREREAFIPGTSGGAPPDAVFTRGQDWGFPPLHPERIREQGYRYTIACLRHHLQCARILRLDHVIGLHRLFCIPNGMEASQGVYLRYRAEELYAILSLESHRSKAVIVGEDLGTVPSSVRPALKKHGVHRMYVLHYELATNPRKRPPPVSQSSVASLNTHDMSPFAAFWQGLDIAERRELGLLDRKGARGERETHRHVIRALSTFLQRKGWLKETSVDTLSALKACLSFLADSQAWLVLVNLEDLWLETKSQNIPTTEGKHPNWRRKAGYSLEEFCQMPQVVATLRIINRLRKQGGQR